MSDLETILAEAREAYRVKVETDKAEWEERVRGYEAFRAESKRQVLEMLRRELGDLVEYVTLPSDSDDYTGNATLILPHAAPIKMRVGHGREGYCIQGWTQAYPTCLFLVCAPYHNGTELTWKTYHHQEQYRFGAGQLMEAIGMALEVYEEGVKVQPVPPPPVTITTMDEAQAYVQKKVEATKVEECWSCRAVIVHDQDGKCPECGEFDLPF